MSRRNLLLNPGFNDINADNLPDYWTLQLTPILALAANTLFPAQGGNQITITSAGANLEGIRIKPGLTNWLKVKPSTTYTFSFGYKVTAGYGGVLQIYSFNGDTQGTRHINATDLTSTTAVRYSATFTTDINATNLWINILAYLDGDTIIVSPPKLEEGSVATPYKPSEPSGFFLFN